MARLTLADGRTLAYTDGDPDGTPVVLFHGAPGSRGFRPRDDETRAAGVRLITFDRPGYGDSDPVETPTVLGVADDVAQLADALGLDRFAVAAWSGGGPTAVATAYRLPERVTGLALVSAPGPLDEVPDGWQALGDFRRPTAEMARREPHRSVRSIGRHMEPFLADPVSFLGRGRGPDGEILRDPELGAMLRAQVTAAIAPGPAGIAGDLVAMWIPWGFRLADVRVPTTVFHAALDRNNEQDARTYAAAIPGASLVIWPEVGHLGILRRWPEVLAALVGPPLV
ncbi:MAG: alpha/beta fold hydrolase [Acidimicrobiia bacterium]